MLPEHGPMSRTYNFVKFLNKKGHNAIGFGASYPHNTDLQLIPDKKKYVKWNSKIPWVYVKTCNYKGSMIKRIYAMWQFYQNTKIAVKEFGKPDAIIGSSAPPTDMLLAIKLARKYKCKAITEVRDLWPESIVEFGVASKNNPIVRILRMFEKWAYKSADKCIFTMEGAYDYISEQGWDNIIPEEKIVHINNGIDLEEFDRNRKKFQIDDSDLRDDSLFKVIYTGSIRKANNLGLLVDVAKEVNNPNIKFLIWGDGNELDSLRERIENEGISNVSFKGKVDKKYIPYILSCSDLNIAHISNSSILRFGISFNKLFEYFAAGKPVLCDFDSNYNPVVIYNAGVVVDKPNSINIAKEIDNLSEKGTKYIEYCKNSLLAARDFDFDILTERLIDNIGEIH